MQSSTMRGIFIGVLVIAAVVLYDLGKGRFSKIWQQHEVAPPAAVEVQAAEVIEGNVPLVVEWIGTTIGYINAQIRPKVQGYLLTQCYTNGAYVKKDQPLFLIDQRQFRVSLDQAIAQMYRAKAELEKSDIDVRRYTPLSQQGAISQQELDQAVQDQLANRASLKAAEANVEQAQLNLSWTAVNSPIDGIAGISVAQIGDLVSEQTLLTTISQVDPIKVQFTISEREYLSHIAYLREKNGGGGGSVKEFVVQMALADGSLYPFSGRDMTIDREVSASMGTIKVQVLFPNPGNIIRPGQYAKVRLVVHLKNKSLLVPQRAVTEVQGNYQIAVLSADNKVAVRSVELAQRVGDLWVVSSGLKPGEKVVVEGLQKIRPGMLVNPQFLAPTNFLISTNLY